MKLILFYVYYIEKLYKTTEYLVLDRRNINEQFLFFSLFSQVKKLQSGNSSWNIFAGSICQDDILVPDVWNTFLRSHYDK